MAAGLGFKTFTTGEVLTAADTNGYLMQGVLVFASSAARAAAITSPQEGQYSYLKDTNSTEYYDGAAWIAAPIGDITGVTAGTGISGGGTSGTVTVTNSMATEIAAKGDLIVGTGSATFDNLTVGANATVLTADSSTATGLKWAAAGGGGAVAVIKAQTIGSAVSSVTLTNAFSTTYDNYRVIVSGTTSSAASGCAFRITLGSANTLYYYAGVFTSYNSTVSGLGGANVGFWLAGSLDIVSTNLAMDIYQPFLTSRTYMTANNTFNNGRGGGVWGAQDSATSFTDLTLTAESGTLTGGTVYVYGYAKV
jgi:hypothetical protein